MRYYKILNDNRPVLIGEGAGGIEITEKEYSQLKTIINNRPSAPIGFSYRLTANLKWELYELPVVYDDETENEEPEHEIM